MGSITIFENFLSRVSTFLNEIHSRKLAEIRNLLSRFSEFVVCFTYPYSMVSRWLGREKPVEYYHADLHGKSFTLSKILLIVEQNGMPEEGWKAILPGDLAPSIEAQVWNHELLNEFKKHMKS